MVRMHPVPFSPLVISTIYVYFFIKTHYSNPKSNRRFLCRLSKSAASWLGAFCQAVCSSDVLLDYTDYTLYTFLTPIFCIKHFSHVFFIDWDVWFLQHHPFSFSPCKLTLDHVMSMCASLSLLAQGATAEGRAQEAWSDSKGTQGWPREAPARYRGARTNRGLERLIKIELY